MKHSASPLPPVRPAQPWYHPSSIARSIIIRPRLYIAAIAGGATLMLLPANFSASLREALAWDVGALVYLGFALQIAVGCTAETIRARAAQQDDSKSVILFIILISIAASFVSIANLLGDVAASGRDSFTLRLGLAGATILLSWLVMQETFALHYAHEFYSPSDDPHGVAGGLDFPGDGNPDYWDFFYFATSIGAASQTSDVSIRTKSLRRLVTLHAIVSFFFNATVLAFAVNIAVSVLR